MPATDEAANPERHRDGQPAQQKLAGARAQRPPEGQKLWAQAGFRPVDPKVAADFAADFPMPQKLWTIDDLGGWSQVDPALFDKDNGTITKIYKQATG